MFVHERQRALLDQLTKRPRWEITQLQDEMGVSRSTLRRDLLELEARGDVVRVHGGVVHRDYLQGEPTFDRRRREAVQAKRAIGAAAVDLISDNSIIYVDAGTTCQEVARRVVLHPGVKVFTHSLRVALDAATTDAPASVVLIGGEVRKVSQAVVGGLALDWLKHLHFDLAFVAASGLDADGPSTTELSESAVKQAIVARSTRAVLIADAGKWDNPAAVRFAGWGQVGTWVTDGSIAPVARDAVERQGVEVIVARSDEKEG